MAIDLKMTVTGELIISPSGDLEISWGDEQVALESVFRLKTTKGDWTLSPGVGCSLEEFIGAPNSEQTHRQMESVISRELSKGSLVVNPTVTVMPTNENEVLIFVEIPSTEDPERNIIISTSFDMRKGLVFSRTGVQLN
jgi:hypothetical protein